MSSPKELLHTEAEIEWWRIQYPELNRDEIEELLGVIESEYQDDNNEGS